MAILTTQTDLVRADSSSWQQQIRSAVRSVDQLLERLKLPPNQLENAPIEALRDFPTFVPLPYLARIRRGDIDDPLLTQVLPTPAEDQSPGPYSIDPLGESASTLQPGMLQKYAGRVLLVTTGVCAVNCRYCFRRHFPYDEAPKSPGQWQGAIEQIADDRSLEEVILSGGDPLMLVDKNLEQLVMQLDSISHLKRLRIHTRLPIVIPQRVTDQLLKLLSASRLQQIMVIHSNHAREIDDAVESALARLGNTGTILLNQSVLLHRVNDRTETLIALSKRLLECRVLPYYLHKNDAVIGTSHFEVSVKKGIELIEEMRKSLPGYAVPQFVQEIAGQPNKTVLA
jgi:EF-P beta-lysylation protein EpmB